MKNVFKNKKNVLNIYVTAGYPKLNDTILISQELEKNGVDIIEIGMPFSDPLADGPTIQSSSQIAIKNGITIDIIFQQIIEIRKTVTIPIILMGYYNQILQYGTDSFFKKAKKVGVNGFIIPDLPLDVYQKKHQKIVTELNLNMIFLVTPQTSDNRIKTLDAVSNGFLYIVSSFAITGSKKDIQKNQISYFEHLKSLKLKKPKLIGFGIHNKATYTTACKYAEGAIIGSAFIKAISNKNQDLKTNIKQFIEGILIS